VRSLAQAPRADPTLVRLFSAGRQASRVLHICTQCMEWFSHSPALTYGAGDCRGLRSGGERSGKKGLKIIIPKLGCYGGPPHDPRSHCTQGRLEGGGPSETGQTAAMACRCPAFFRECSPRWAAVSTQQGPEPGGRGPHERWGPDAWPGEGGEGTSSGAFSDRPIGDPAGPSPVGSPAIARQLPRPRGRILRQSGCAQSG